MKNMTSNEKKTIQVSIGLPVYNGEKYIRDALNSLISQTFEEFEIIISDNASTDGTEEICREYAKKDKRIKYIKQIKNNGAVENFKYVFNEANAEKFIWAASDDTWDKNRLESLNSAMTEKEIAVISKIKRYSNYKCISEFTPHNYNKEELNKYLMREEALGDKVYYIYGLLWRKKIKKIVSEMKNDYGDDALFAYKLLQIGDLKAIENTVLHINTHYDSTGATDARKYRYNIIRMLFFAHPFRYYLRVYKETINKKRTELIVMIFLKMIKSQLHLWYRAYFRMMHGRAYVYGAINK